MTDEDVVQIFLDDFFTREHLPLREDVLNKYEDLFDALPDLDVRGIVAPWKGKFLMVLPAGLALATAAHRDRLTEWVDGTKGAFAEANRNDENKEWTLMSCLVVPPCLHLQSELHCCIERAFCLVVRVGTNPSTRLDDGARRNAPTCHLSPAKPDQAAVLPRQSAGRGSTPCRSPARPRAPPEAVACAASRSPWSAAPRRSTPHPGGAV